MPLRLASRRHWRRIVTVTYGTGGLDMRKEREASAYHEAGHAVACEVLGLRVVGVDILVHDGRSGHCQYRPQDPDPAPRWLRDHILRRELTVTLAGPVAEAQRFRHRRWEILSSPTPDIIEAEAMHEALREVKPAVADSHWACWFPIARDLVRHQWRATSALASALLERDSLTGDEVDAIVLPQLEPAWRWLEGRGRVHLVTDEECAAPADDMARSAVGS